MYEEVEILETPLAKNIYMIAGWRQWADGGSVSSGLPQFLIQQTQARLIGRIKPDGFYIFQIPGTHDLVRPVVKFKEGYPEFIETERNEFFYAGDQEKGVVYFVGDEPHMDIERYTAAFLHAAQVLGVKRIVGLGGVYGELPYDKERTISSTYSLPALKEELEKMAVNFSEYHGGASIGSFICRRASEKNMEYVSFYAFVPTYDFSSMGRGANAITIENDFLAWLGIMRRIDYMLKLGLDLSDLEKRSARLLKLMDTKIEEIETNLPDLNVRSYLAQLAEEFEEKPFQPLDDFWEEQIGRLFDKLDEDEAGPNP